MSDQRRDFLLELGTEELPAGGLEPLAASLEQGLLEQFDRAGLDVGASKRFATPRRLAVLIRDVSPEQPARRRERRGPLLKAAFDSNGHPTKAAMGFARACSVEVAELQTIESEKGAWLAHVSTEPGVPTVSLLPNIVRTTLAGLPIPTRMRWADRDDEFVRPVHWLVLLWGSDVVPADVFGVAAGRETRGHRFHHPGSLPIVDPTAYATTLRNEGWVVADFEVREAMIRSMVESAARGLGGCAQMDSTLLANVTGLVEWPVPIVGSFEHRFLHVPAEALITTMKDNQKYFPVLNADGDLMPHFIAIGNIESRDPDEVRAGNERVIRPRFSDAEFFWNHDRHRSLASYRDDLKKVVFQQRLGTLHDKSIRVARLAQILARLIGGDPSSAERAGELCKCDLATNMVQEFPSLQGTMGRYYALQSGESEAVAQALEEQYLPRFAGDALPVSAAGQALAVADRIDSLLGIFALGQVPSGAKDPFALRRAALGILRILIEGALDLDLECLFQRAAEGFDASVKAEGVVEHVFEFVMDRLRAYYLEQGLRPDEFDSVLHCRPSRPLDFHRRLRAVAAFRSLPEAASLAAANKRIRNILKQVQGTIPFAICVEHLEHNAEASLAGKLAELSSETIPLMETGAYDAALARLAALREPVDRFFDEVMVMTNDDTLRGNRLALLNEISSLFLRVADFSRLQP